MGHWICGSILAFRSPKSASGIFCHLLPFYSKKKMQNTPNFVDLLQDTSCGGHCKISDDVHDCKAPREEPKLAISKILATRSRDQKQEPRIELFETFLKRKNLFGVAIVQIIYTNVFARAFEFRHFLAPSFLPCALFK